MTSGTARQPSQRHNRTIILPIEQEKYRPIVSAPQQFRAWRVHPSFVMPYMTGSTDEAAKALYLRQWGIPYEGLVYVFGRDPNYWYRMETQFGRKSIVATTVKTAEIPVDLLADEHHEKINSEKVYIATTVAVGCVFGAEISPTASTEDLKNAYGVFKNEALAVDPE